MLFAHRGPKIAFAPSMNRAPPNCVHERRSPARIPPVALAALLLGCGSATPGGTASSDAAPGTQRARVLGTVVRSARTLILIRTPSGVITATEEHPFAKWGAGWTRAGALAGGDRLITATHEPTEILSVEHVQSPATPVYNLVVEGSHTYYVGSEELLVHNQTCGGGFASLWQRLTGRKATPRPAEPTALTLAELMDLESYRDGSKLKPPPGSPERLRVDQLEARARRKSNQEANDRENEAKNELDGREKARRWARQVPWPGSELEVRPAQSPGPASALRPPPGTRERFELDRLEHAWRRTERRGQAESPPELSEREKAKLWLRTNPWPKK
jgi:hypothetical protein